jgi:N-acetylmuramic acid 6-phosphate etherase
VALLANGQGRLQHRIELGPANARLQTDAQLLRLFRAIHHAMGAPDALGIGLAGARDERDRARIQSLAAKVWRGVPCLVSHDLETALAAAGGQLEARPQVLILSGTGSCCYGRVSGNREVKVGGWGHILGDRGSAYEIAIHTLKAVVRRYDLSGHWPRLGQRILRTLQLNDPDELIGWAHKASKADLAKLAVEVFDAWHSRDPIADHILQQAAVRLAEDAVAAARRLADLDTPVRFVLAGSVLLKQPRFARLLRDRLRQGWRQCQVVSLPRESAWGAVELARLGLERVTSRSSKAMLDMMAGGGHRLAAPRELLVPRSRRPSPTEARNARSRLLDKLSISAAIELMLSEEAKVPTAIRTQANKLEQAVKVIVRSLRSGGRLFYVGAGTSGRLGVLDASECPATFRTPPDWVQGIIAGGPTALWQSIEGAEDDARAGAMAIAFRGVQRRDVVLGIAASGRTPFVWGALAEAKRRRARTILLCFNPFLVIPRLQRPALVINPNVGPEVLTGSTRLKAGTATKLILNLLSTISMVRLGKVVSNLMVDLDPGSTKLRDRAIRIVRHLTGVGYLAARTALAGSGWRVRAACLRLMKRRKP